MASASTYGLPIMKMGRNGAMPNIKMAKGMDTAVSGLRMVLKDTKGITGKI